MRKFWMVLRYKDELLQQHPNFNDRNVFYLQDIGRRSEINTVLFPSLDQAEAYAITLSMENPMETIIVLNQHSVFELPELPQPIKKVYNSDGELVPNEA